MMEIDVSGEEAQVRILRGLKGEQVKVMDRDGADAEVILDDISYTAGGPAITGILLGQELKPRWWLLVRDLEWVGIS